MFYIYKNYIEHLSGNNFFENYVTSRFVILVNMH